MDRLPSGKIHATSTILLAAAGGFFMIHSGKPLPQVIALSGGVLAGLILTPDLDIDPGRISIYPCPPISRKAGCRSLVSVLAALQPPDSSPFTPSWFVRPVIWLKLADLLHYILDQLF